jgi:hypothetical protein
MWITTPDPCAIIAGRAPDRAAPQEAGSGSAPIPLGIVQHREAACRCRRAANDMDSDFYPTGLSRTASATATAFGSRKIGGNKLDILRERTGFPCVPWSEP